MTEKERSFIVEKTKAQAIVKEDRIQALWSNYGEIGRVWLKGGAYKSVVVKRIKSKKGIHPKGWNTKLSHQRKVKSYQIEEKWYQQYSQVCETACKVPDFLGIHEKKSGEKLLLLEDLFASGFTDIKSKCSLNEAKTVLQWLAHFHACFLNATTDGLWETGTYWHLATRPDELQEMEEGLLKENAHKLDALLRNATFQTLVHGDAKLANFCFSKDGNKVAGVDFQYVGGGVGIKDVAYFMGSCFTGHACEEYEEKCLNFYFSELHKALQERGQAHSFEALEQEWRELYPIAWADFVRFLKGWQPNHTKIHAYSLKMVEKAMHDLP